MTAGQVLDGTPRYVRVTFLAATSSGRRRRSRWVGQVRRQGDLLRGERKDDAPGVEGGVILNVLVAHVDEVVKVEREDPVYGEWVETPGWRGQP